MSAEPNANARAAQLSKLAVVGLVMTFVCLPLGTLLSVIALVRINGSKGALRGQLVAIVALALVIPLLGATAAVAIPSFLRFQCRSRQVEAKLNLKALFVAEEQFQLSRGSYTKDAGALGFKPDARSYSFLIEQASAQSFKAEARGIEAMDGDRWEIDQTNTVTNVDKKCD